MTQNPGQTAGTPPQHLERTRPLLRLAALARRPPRHRGQVARGCVLRHRPPARRGPPGVRAGLIVLILLGGIGVTLYLIAWAFLPNIQEEIVAEKAVRGGDVGGIILLAPSSSRSSAAQASSMAAAGASGGSAGRHPRRHHRVAGHPQPRARPGRRPVRPVRAVCRAVCRVVWRLVRRGLGTGRHRLLPAGSAPRRAGRPAAPRPPCRRARRPPASCSLAWPPAPRVRVDPPFLPWRPTSRTSRPVHRHRRGRGTAAPASSPRSSWPASRWRPTASTAWGPRSSAGPDQHVTSLAVAPRRPQRRGHGLAASARA